jgi:hypothetical protein
MLKIAANNISAGTLVNITADLPIRKIALFNHLILINKAMISRNNHISTIHICNLLHHIHKEVNLFFRSLYHLIFGSCIITCPIYAVMININQIMILYQSFCLFALGIHMHQILSQNSSSFVTAVLLKNLYPVISPQATNTINNYSSSLTKTQFIVRQQRSHSKLSIRR